MTVSEKNILEIVLGPCVRDVPEFVYRYDLLEEISDEVIEERRILRMDRRRIETRQKQIDEVVAVWRII